MTKILKVQKTFDWNVHSYEIDYDLLELQLHSLYKYQNLGFDSDLYKEELSKSNYILAPTESAAIRLSLISFVKSLDHVLTSFGIDFETDWEKILDYGDFKLLPRNLAFNHIKSVATKNSSNVRLKFVNQSQKAKSKLKNQQVRFSRKDNVIYLKDKSPSKPKKKKFNKITFKDISNNINPQNWNIKKPQLDNSFAKISTTLKHNHVTTGAAITNVRKDLIKFERSIIDSIVLQLKEEKVNYYNDL
ncbi:hypothetical protein H1Q58_03265 [Planococcus maritimus]|uniref:Uncharacterized protein n=1 Tax=Planococcus maritimus TaxID=192421 RepID=A0A7D7QVY7_PLAMR|nr:hypothetical protein [Planococcus maritimus]QMT18054.1 hypothetical protein H1Q58_03265 [Planococcus maritimus]